MKKEKASSSERESEHRRLSLGFRFGIVEETDGTYRWYVKQWKKTIGTGTKSTRKAADVALQDTLGRLVVAAARTSGDRSGLKTKLNALVQRRPYIAAWVLDTLSNAANISRGHIVSRAAEEERSRWADDEGEGKAPLPTHHLTKPAKEVAGAMWDLCQQLGLVRAKAWRYGSDMLGRGFTHPDAESTEDVMETGGGDVPSRHDPDDGDVNPMTKDSPV